MSETVPPRFWPEPPVSGWWFTAHPVGVKGNRHTVLATWYAKTRGTEWIHHLIEQGKARPLKGSDNYHGRYIVELADLRPFLDAPPYRRDGYEHQHHPERIAACATDAAIEVDVLDCS